MKITSSARATILSVGLLSPMGMVVDAFTPTSSSDNLSSTYRNDVGSTSATQLDASSLAATSREEDLLLTRQLIMDHEKRSTTASKEQFIQQMERPSVESSSTKTPTTNAATPEATDRDVSVPYNAAAKLAYESYEDKSKISFEAFEAQYLADAVADVKSKQAKETTEMTFDAAVATPSSSPSSSSSSFFDTDPAIREKQLIEQTKRLFNDNIKLGLADGGECLADNFQFCAAVVGPIGKEAFMDALGGFKLEDSFDIEQNRFGYSVSPTQPNRVYFLTSNKATMTNDFMGVAPQDSPNQELVLPPECHHADFDEKTGKLTEYGFYTVDRQYGNTGGLGGAFGFFYGVGKALPFPEAKPFKKSIPYALFNWIGNRISKNKKSEDDTTA